MPLLALMLFSSPYPQCAQLSAREDAQQRVIGEALTSHRPKLCIDNYSER